MAHLSLSFLGTFRVVADDQVLTAFATDKTRALLAYLAVENGRAHGRVALAGLLWPDLPEERARQSLRQTLLYLRQVLGPCADRLRVDRDVVEFTPAPGDWLDVAEFSSLSDACRRHRHQRAERCLPCLRRRETMAALYEGDFLAGFFIDNSDRFEEWAVLKREWLHRHAVDSLEVLAAYRERRGDVQAARDLAHRHVALEPWSEETYRTLMRLIAREGHRSAALAQFESCRRALADELGVEPTAETMALYDHIRRGTLPPEPHIPAPPPPPPLLGRESELAELAECIAGPQTRLVTLVGPGGIGKTHLARHVAQDHAGVFRDGVAFASLGAIEGGASDAEIGVVVAEALGLASTSAGDPWAAVLEHVRHRELLLVLDNLEQLLDCPTAAPDEPTCADRIARLLHLAPQIVLLATSRERLRLVEEQVYDLDGLAYPASPAEPDPERFGAVALFVERARQVQRRFALGASTVSDVVRICTLVDGVPLGIELAAATLGERTLADVATALGTTLDALTTPLRDVTPRHRSLRAAFEHSWALLTDHEQQALAALAVFAGPFDAPAASEVLGANASAVLATLLRKSLLRRVDNDRLGFHSTIAEYAADKLAAHHERAQALRARHATYYVALARRLEPEWRGAGAGAATSALQHERRNLLAAWAWAIERQDYAHIEPLLGALS
ncbi:MAG: ATP-binding protein, partial [Anaerolineae bacterium]